MILRPTIPSSDRTHSNSEPQGNSYYDPEATRLVEAVGRRHGSLDDKAADVLPALLEKRDEVVDGHHDVGNQLLLLHLDVADGDTHAENLLQLELDGGLDVGDLAAEVVGVGDGGGELAGCEKQSKRLSTADDSYGEG